MKPGNLCGTAAKGANSRGGEDVALPADEDSPHSPLCCFASEGVFYL